jgi:hypothetical protein
MPRYRPVPRESAYAKRDRADGAARTKRKDAAAPTSYEPPLLLPGLVAESLARHRSGTMASVVAATPARRPQFLLEIPTPGGRVPSAQSLHPER